MAFCPSHPVTPHILRPTFTGQLAKHGSIMLLHCGEQLLPCDQLIDLASVWHANCRGAAQSVATAILIEPSPLHLHSDSPHNNSASSMALQWSLANKPRPSQASKTHRFTAPNTTLAKQGRSVWKEQQWTSTTAQKRSLQGQTTYKEP